jgi:hypothetical protein
MSAVIALMSLLGPFGRAVADPSGDPQAAVVGVTPSAERRAFDEGLQQLKKEAVDLHVALSQLREDMLFPASSQLAVFLSIDVGEFLALDSVELKIDNKEVANYLYSAREAAALLKGGSQRLYLGSVKSGDHELLAVFKGRGPHSRDYRRAASVHVIKGVVPKYVELKITDRTIRAQPEFEIRDWEGE